MFTSHLIIAKAGYNVCMHTWYILYMNMNLHLRYVMFYANLYGSLN